MHFLRIRSPQKFTLYQLVARKTKVLQIHSHIHKLYIIIKIYKLPNIAGNTIHLHVCLYRKEEMQAIGCFLGPYKVQIRSGIHTKNSQAMKNGAALKGLGEKVESVTQEMAAMMLMLINFNNGCVKIY